MPGLHRKDLLGLKDLTAEEITLILDTAEPCREIFARELRKMPTLRGKTVVTLFFEPSTRTRTSFEVAAKWMSADAINITVATSSVVKGESFVDTAKTIEAVGADVIIIRHAMAGAPALLAKSVKAAVINAGDGAHEHPTQALLDLYSIRRHKGRIAGLNVTIVGDILHSRVAKSNIWGLTKLGAHVTVVGPPTLMPPGLEELGVRVCYNLDEALEGADVVNVLRIQLERQKKGLFPSIKEYSRLYGINKARLDRLAPDALLMHPGPANLGVEITEEAAEDPRSVIVDQVSNGVAVRMALLYLLTGGGREDGLLH
ncbi:MAG TPA: aspartate carbamoyltransferase catalytic subunit [Firmicutes bacterium]|jgi:aspartate carbamoyltransferase catalytic subunit|nr:aspartate carbamoyltransferase catalytic subunit [Bacillota bacterium]HOQ24083.1 aspartate carbamoyltransferase catalytic subunit [Bacillota bacterium]HPT67513.1 aspartate carbamoyltransferase catalytic subunit [Bacillota bacterium]